MRTFLLEVSNARFSPECTAARWDATEGPDEKGSDRNVPERQPAGTSGETGQRTSGPGRSGAIYWGEER